MKTKLWLLVIASCLLGCSDPPSVTEVFTVRSLWCKGDICEVVAEYPDHSLRTRRFQATPPIWVKGTFEITSCVRCGMWDSDVVQSVRRLQ